MLYIFYHNEKKKTLKKKKFLEVENLLANAGVKGSIPGLGASQML